MPLGRSSDLPLREQAFLNLQGAAPYHLWWGTGLDRWEEEGRVSVPCSDRQQGPQKAADMDICVKFIAPSRTQRGVGWLWGRDELSFQAKQSRLLIPTLLDIVSEFLRSLVVCVHKATADDLSRYSSLFPRIWGHEKHVHSLYFVCVCVCVCVIKLGKLTNTIQISVLIHTCRSLNCGSVYPLKAISFSIQHWPPHQKTRKKNAVI